MGLAIGIGNGILFTSQRGVSSIIPGLIDDLCARATYCENKTCTTAILEEIAAVRYTAPVLPTGLLVDYPGASAAYSLRNLIDTTTSVVRVRRSSDNTEQDFTSEEITDGTLTTFSGASDGFVTTWYDQSENSNNATQSTATKQPKLVSNGVVLMSNNKPSLRFKEGPTKRVFSQPLVNELNSSFSVFSVVQGEIAQEPYEGLFTTNTMMKLARVDSGNWGTFPISETNTNLYTGAINLVAMISLDGNRGDFYTNSNLDGSFTSTQGQPKREIGGGNIDQEFNGFISEMIIYPTYQSTNRVGIETNINTEYNIYTPEPEPIPIGGLLFDYSGASVAYSLRQLTTFDTGFETSLVKVRRSSDNTEKDFTATQITDGTLTTFTGANDGFIVVWRDQSGNGNDLQQLTASEQPKLVSNGNLVLSNNKPTVSFNQNYLNQIFDLNPLEVEHFLVVKANSYPPTIQSDTGLYNYGNGGSMHYSWTDGDIYDDFGTTLRKSVGTPPETLAKLNLYNVLSKSSEWSARLNSTEFFTTSSNTVGFPSNQKFGIDPTNYSLTGNVSEFIIYPSDQSPNRTGIETNINAEYSIY